jgi:DNA-binding response OmpR family regulator
VTRSADGRPTVLVVDDESAVADVLALKIRDEYETRVAYGGEEALKEIEESVDAVLLDRRMPAIHGDDVLAEIRDREYDCVVVMTTAVDPELNILEMDFDDYLSKPIETETLLSTLDQQLDTKQSGDPKLDAFFAVVSKLDVLESELTPAELAESDEYEKHKGEAERLGRELQSTHEDFEDIVDTFRDIERNSG